MLMDKKVYTREEAAEYLGISYSTLIGLNIPNSRLTPRCIRYQKADLDAYLESCKGEDHNAQEEITSQVRQ